MSFGELTPPPLDSLLALMGRFNADPRPRKIDLGIGVYRDAHGDTPVFAAVKMAEQHLAQYQTSKAYLGTVGDTEFVSRLGQTALGGHFAGLQTVGGSGALRLAAELLARTLPRRRLWLSVPTWTNHLPIFAAAGLPVTTVHPDAMLDALAEAKRGDAVLLHACCHNPTGIDVGLEFWTRVATLMEERELVPLVDMAYQGLGRGWREDAAGVELLAQRLPNLLVAYSCDKNFGLYRERVGALFMRASSTRETALLVDHAAALARSDYSMPPDHGAAVVRVILNDPALTDSWRAELAGMRARIRELRHALAAHGRIGAIDLSPVAHGHGLFALLPLAAEDIDSLQSEHGIYMAPSGRMNIAGLAADDVERFTDALRAVQRQDTALAR